MTQEELLEKLGPLAPLAGVWEGAEGDDISPSDDRQTENNLYREHLVLEPFGPVDNHEQQLWGLRYSTVAWRLQEKEAFHDEVGYWLWDPQEKQVMRCFIVPRGVTVLAGGTVEPEAREFTLRAELGSPVYGICSNPFLDREFKTVRYELTVTIHPDGRFSYAEDTQMQMKGRSEIFHHTDRNTLRKISS